MSEYNININKTNEQKKSEKMTDFINVLQYSSLVKKKDKKNTSAHDYSRLFKKGSINYNSLI